MQVQEQYQDSPLYDNTAFTADCSYIKFELSSDQTTTPPEQFIVLFSTHFITVSGLLEGFLTRVGLTEKYPPNKIKLSLREGTPIQPEQTLEQLRLSLYRESASGVTVRAQVTFSQISNQAALAYYIHTEPDYNSSNINKWFLLLNNQEPFSISIKKSIPFQKLQSAISDTLNAFYKNDTTPADITFYKIEKKKDDGSYEFAWNKVSEMSEVEVGRQILSAEREIMGVEVTKAGKWPASEVESEEYLIFHIDNLNKIKLKFAHIANYRVGELLQHLNIEHSNTLGIKIVDQIFPPYALLKKASKYFDMGEGHFAKNVECRLVTERQMFYRSMERMESDYQIPKEMVTVEKEKQYDACRQLAQQRMNELEASESKPFASAKEISIITFYTSSVQVIDKQGNNTTIVYKSLNEFLRTSKFGLVQYYNQQWRYKFSATLIKSLQKLEPFNEINQQTGKVTVYRGISGFQLQGKKGELYVAKEFLSTSISKEKANNFAQRSSIGTFIEIECISGRPISNFSVYKFERQVLFMPYTYFRIEERDDSSNIVRLKLKEIPAKEFKSNPATEILWVDDKLKEGEKVIGSLSCPMHTTFLHQLKSTAELNQWIIHNSQRIKGNPAIKVAVISNMRRRQNGVDKTDAGAETVKQVRNQLPKSDMILYISHIEGTKAALRANNIDPQSISVFSKRSQLREFIAHNCAPLEQSKQQQQEVISETLNKTFLSTFSSEASNIFKRGSSENSV